ncbi:MAG TPA: hypothetical protein VIC35_03295 [Acidimicrobiia bacterium]|jgi:hypothetical protein
MQSGVLVTDATETTSAGTAPAGSAGSKRPKRSWGEIAISVALGVAVLVVLASAVGTVIYYAFYRKNTAALPWHYWIAPVLGFSVIVVVIAVLPFSYYFKVWRLKHRGR